MSFRKRRLFRLQPGGLGPAGTPELSEEPVHGGDAQEAEDTPAGRSSPWHLNAAPGSPSPPLRFGSVRPAELRKLPWWVKALLAYLAAITIFGKGPTYIGVPPFFWGEITMALSLALIAPWLRRSGYLVRNGTLTAAIVLFMAVGAVLTAISFPRWRLDALRDAAIWYYGLFFFVGLGLAARERIANRVWWWLRVFWMAALVWNTADLLSKRRLSFSGPIIPWRGVPLFFNSVHEAGEHMALGAVIVLCTATLIRKPVWRAILVPVAVAGLSLFIIAQGRGMRVGVGAGMAAALLLGLTPCRKPHLHTRVLTLSLAAVPLLALFSAVYSDRVLKVAHLDRFEEADPSDPVGTANWRVVWWDQLYRAVMREDPAFGLGFGESLHLYHPLLWRLQENFIVRSPHNFNVTVFARMGYVGAGLWALILTLGIGGLFRRVWRGTVRGQPYEPDRHDELAFWVMMLITTVVNSSFGVLMEGPVLGIWFWFALGFANGRALTTGTTPAMRLLTLRERLALPRPAAASFARVR